jgi:putative holliday junction resolvase
MTFKKHINKQVNIKGRILAIDYGTKRTGIAVTDELQLIASGLTTVDTNDLVDFLEKYMSSQEVGMLVVGDPQKHDGTFSETGRKILAFVKKLKKKFPGLKIELEDESFTSSIAKDAMLRGGLPKMKRRNKKLVDKISAVLILQSYMERLRK